MIVFCSKCGINWASLWDQESNGDVYEFCPECKTDSFLEEGNDIEAFIKDQITGDIVNAVTGEKLIQRHR
jgi:hypothetical protein